MVRIEAVLHPEEAGLVWAALDHCEENRTASSPVRDLSPGCAIGDASACDGAPDRCNGSLQMVASAALIAEALEQARISWISDRDGRRLRCSLLELLAELHD
jgi:hypothetical protein